MIYTVQVRAAIRVSERAHRAQRRRGTDHAYVIHPFSVAMVLVEAGAGEDLVVAGLLHDTVEDTALTFQEIETQFGASVAGLVAAVTKPGAKSADLTGGVVAQLQASGQLDAYALKAADLICNLTDILADARASARPQTAVTALFGGQGKAARKLDRYRQLGDALFEVLHDSGFADLAAQLGDLNGQVMDLQVGMNQFWWPGFSDGDMLTTATHPPRGSAPS